MQQVTINFEAGLTDSHPTCRDFVAHRAQRQGRALKDIASDMDYAPSQFSRKLANGRESTDTARFTLDDLELYMSITKDTKPVVYLVEKYLSAFNEREELLRRLAEIDQNEKIASQIKAVNG